MARFFTKLILIGSFLFLPPPYLRVSQEAPSSFRPALVPDLGQQWEWYCDDSREPAEVLGVVYDKEGTLDYDPDTCDSEIALLFRGDHHSGRDK